jgi:hypothetical protein
MIWKLPCLRWQQSDLSRRVVPRCHLSLGLTLLLLEELSYSIYVSDGAPGQIESRDRELA